MWAECQLMWWCRDKGRRAWMDTCSSGKASRRHCSVCVLQPDETEETAWAVADHSHSCLPPHHHPSLPPFSPPPFIIRREVHALGEANSYDWSYVNLNKEILKWVFQCGFTEEVGKAYFECRGPSPIGWVLLEEKEQASSALASLFLSGCDNIHWCLS